MQGYYFITDSRLSLKGNILDIEAACKAKVQVIQYRNKTAPAKVMLQEARQIRKITSGSILLINDRLDVALAVGADGVHLGQDDMPYEEARKILGPNKIIGLSVKTIDQAKQAEAMGANYIGVGPIFQTSTKDDAGNPLGIDFLKQIKKEVTLPVVAIGGITLENAKEVIGAGADALCAISVVVADKNAEMQMLHFQNSFKV